MKQFGLILLILSIPAYSQQALLECSVKKTGYDTIIPTEPKFLFTLDQRVEVAIDSNKKRIVSIPREYVPGCNPSAKDMEVSTGCECRFEEQTISCKSSTKTTLQKPTLNLDSGTNKVDFTINRYSGSFSGMGVHERLSQSLELSALQNKSTLIMYEGRCKIYDKRQF
jgi:hypothetical protein